MLLQSRFVGAAVLAVVALLMIPAAAQATPVGVGAGLPGPHYRAELAPLHVSDSLPELLPAPVHKMPAPAHNRRRAYLLGGLSLVAALGFLGMAMVVTVTQIQPTNQIPTHDKFIADVTMADADTVAAIPHGLGVIPLEYTLTPKATITAVPIATIAPDATNLNLTKTNLAGTGGTYRVVAKKPHTLGL